MAREPQEARAACSWAWAPRRNTRMLAAIARSAAACEAAAWRCAKPIRSLTAAGLASSCRTAFSSPIRARIAAGVAASLALVAAAVTVAWRQRLHLAREIAIAAARAGIQLAAVGAILLLVFQHAGLAGAAGWLAIIVTVAGQVAARRACGLPG